MDTAKLRVKGPGRMGPPVVNLTTDSEPGAAGAGKSYQRFL